MSNSRARLARQSRSSEYSTLFESPSTPEKAGVQQAKVNWKQAGARGLGSNVFLAGALLLVAADLILGVIIATSASTQPDQLLVLLWNWSHLFSLLLVVISGGFWYARRSTQQARVQAVDSQHEQLLYTYLDRMSGFSDRVPGFSAQLESFSQEESQSEEEEVDMLTRAWTILALRKLDGERKGLIIRFLCESKLLQQKLGSNLQGFDLKNTDLSKLHLSQVNFTEGDLRQSDLSYADLGCAGLKQADLGGASLRGANLSGADLNGAILEHADLSGANLSGAEMSGAILDGANLSGANLNGAVLDSATLLHTVLSAGQLEKARSTIGLIS